MAISGLWNQAQSQSGAAKWGTGINPIHAIETMGEPLRSSQVPTGYGPGAPPAQVPEVLTNTASETQFDEEYADPEWGYGSATATDQRMGWDADNTQARQKTPSAWPSPGYAPNGGVMGGLIRRIRIGDNRAINKLGFKNETVSEGWENKEVGTVSNAETSDPAQYERQTSMQQRDQIRVGSQNPNTGTANEHTAEIGSWRPTWGKRIKPWSGGQRHYDMFPFQADTLLRGFTYRNAGTGYPDWMGANEAYNYQVDPLQRQPVPDPYGGNPVPAPGNVYEEESSDVSTWENAWW